MIPRCPHGVYSPYADGRPSPSCSGCITPTIGITAKYVFISLKDLKDLKENLEDYEDYEDYDEEDYKDAEEHDEDNEDNEEAEKETDEDVLYYDEIEECPCCGEPIHEFPPIECYYCGFNGFDEYKHLRRRL